MNWHLTPALSPSDAERGNVQALPVASKDLGNLPSWRFAARAEDFAVGQDCFVRGEGFENLCGVWIGTTPPGS